MFHFFAKRKARRTLEKYVNAETAESIMAGRRSVETTMHPGKIEFIFALLKNSNELPALAERMKVTVTLSSQHGAVIHDICGPLVVLSFGIIHTDHQSNARVVLVNELHRTLGNEVKIVHGAAEGHFGILGAEPRYSYTFTFPRFDEAFTALTQLSYGEVIEFI